MPEKIERSAILESLYISIACRKSFTKHYEVVSAIELKQQRFPDYANKLFL
jgi:hypothetical protein